MNCFTRIVQDWGISIFGLAARLRAHVPLHPSMLAPQVVLLQSARWDLHAWFVSRGMKPMSAWGEVPFVSEHMLRDYETDARAALFEVVHAFPSTVLWGLVMSPQGVLAKAKSDEPFLQATLDVGAQAAVKAVMKAVAIEFGFVVIDWQGMIEHAQQTDACEAMFCLFPQHAIRSICSGVRRCPLLLLMRFFVCAGSLDGSHVSTDCFLPYMSAACDTIRCLLDAQPTRRQ
jgi:hypothetical protein